MVVRYFVFFIYFTVLPGFTYAQVDEMTMKAIFIERFSRFIEWPADRQGDFFRIQVLGDKKLAQKFRKIYKKLEIKNKTVLIHEHEKVYNTDFRPHVVYVTEKELISPLLKATEKKPVLVISEVPGGAREGAMINIYKKESTLKFEINERSMYNSNLYVSYRLKKAAQHIVDPVRKKK